MKSGGAEKPQVSQQGFERGAPLQPACAAFSQRWPLALTGCGGVAAPPGWWQQHLGTASHGYSTTKTAGKCWVLALQ